MWWCLSGELDRLPAIKKSVSPIHRFTVSDITLYLLVHCGDAKPHPLTPINGFLMKDLDSEKKIAVLIDAENAYCI
jgi:hypothetical protein